MTSRVGGADPEFDVIEAIAHWRARAIAAEGRVDALRALCDEWADNQKVPYSNEYAEGRRSVWAAAEGRVRFILGALPEASDD